MPRMFRLLLATAAFTGIVCTASVTSSDSCKGSDLLPDAVPPDVQTSVAEGEFARSVAEELSSLDIDIESQNCLFLTVREIVGLRALSASQLHTEKKSMRELVDTTYTESSVLIVPGVGTYTGLDEIYEYFAIAVLPEVNQNFFVELLVVPYATTFVSADVYERTDYLIGVWNNFSRVSQPEYFHRYVFQPCSLRIDSHTLRFSEEEGINVFIEEAYSSERICKNLMEWCTGSNSQFADYEACVRFYDALPRSVSADCISSSSNTSYALQGNNTLCKFLHHFLAQFTPEVHCFHSGTGHRPDANNKFKCVPDECSAAIQEATDSEAGGAVVVNCTLDVQMDTEMRLAVMLPHCVEALRAGNCTDACSRALATVDLLAPERAGAVVACTGAIADAPLSATLDLSAVDPLALLRICPSAALPNTECVTGMYPTIDGGCAEADDLENVARLPSSILQRVARREAASPSMNGTLERDVNLIDVEVARGLVPGLQDSELHKTSFGSAAIVPYPGGPLLLSYANVRDAMSNPQGRLPHAFFRQVDLSPDVWSHNLATQHPTGSVAHTASRDALLEAFPALLGGETKLRPFPDILKPAALLQALSTQTSSTGSDNAGVLAEIVNHILRTVDLNIFEDQPTESNEASAATSVLLRIPKFMPRPVVCSQHLYSSLCVFSPPCSLVCSLVLGSYTIFAWFVKCLSYHALYNNRAYHRVTGGLVADASRIARTSLGSWIQSILGESRVARLARQQNLTAAEYKLALASPRPHSLPIYPFADTLHIAAFVGISHLTLNVLRRIAAGGPSHIEIYERDREAYIIEHSRLHPPVASIAFVPRDDVAASGKWGPRVYEANATAAVAQIDSAHRDASAFKDPHVFLPDRPDLFRTMTWNAVESEIRRGEGPTLARVCPGRAFSLRVSKALVNQFLEKVPSASGGNAYREDYELLDALVTAALVAMGLNVIGFAFVVMDALLQRHRLAVYLQNASIDTETPLNDVEEPVMQSVPSLASLCGPSASLLLRQLTVEVQGAKGKKKLLNSVSLNLEIGELTAIMGESGAGKSTLMQVASGRIPSSFCVSGSVLLNTRSEETIEYTVGYVPQNIELVVDELLTAMENLYLACRLRCTADHLTKLYNCFGIKPTEPRGSERVQHALVIDTLRHFGLKMCANTLVGKMSGGERRRLAIATECMFAPTALFCDEPTSGLDGTSASMVMELLKSLAVGISYWQPTAVVVVIHSPRQEVFDTFDKLVVLKRGTVVLDCPAGKAMAALKLTPELVVESAASLLNETETPGSHKSRGNDADMILDAIAVTRCSDLERKREHLIQRDVSFNSFRLLLDEENVKAPIKKPRAEVPFLARASALLWKRCWRVSYIWVVRLYLALPLITFFLIGLPNATAGGEPTPVNLIAQILLSVSLPALAVMSLVGGLATALATRHEKWLSRNEVLSGWECGVSVVMWYGAHVVLYTVPLVWISVGLGLREEFFSLKVARILTFILANTLQEILLFVLLVKAWVNIDQALSRSLDQIGIFVVMVAIYVTSGTIFSGLFYNLSELPTFFCFVGYLSTGFWASVGSLHVALDGISFGECSDNAAQVPLAATGGGIGSMPRTYDSRTCITGAMVYEGLAHGNGNKELIPAWGLAILLCVLVAEVAAIFVVLVRNSYAQRQQKAGGYFKQVIRRCANTLEKRPGEPHAAKADLSDEVFVHTAMQMRLDMCRRDIEARQKRFSQLNAKRELVRRQDSSYDENVEIIVSASEAAGSQVEERQTVANV